MKKINSILLTLALITATTVNAQTTRREIPTTTAIARQLLTNETAAGIRTLIGANTNSSAGGSASNVFISVSGLATVVSNGPADYTVGVSTASIQAALAGDFAVKVTSNSVTPVRLTNAANIFGGDGSLITGLVEAQIGGLLADLAARATTNFPGAISHTNAANRFGGNGALLTSIPPVTGIAGWPANSAGVLNNDGSGVLSWGAGGSGITSNTAYGAGLVAATNVLYDPDAAGYAAYRSLGQRQLDKLSGFVRTLKAASLWDSKSDIFLLQTNYNATATNLIRTWMSNSINYTGTGIVYNAGNRGLRVYGPSSQIDVTGLTASKTNTLIVQGRRILNPANNNNGNTLWGIYNVGGEYVATIENSGVVVAQYNGSSSASATMAMFGTSTPRTNTNTKVWAIAEDSQELSAWIDGVGCESVLQPNYPTNRMASGVTHANGLTNFRMGQSHATLWTGFEADYVLIFNRLLTTAEVRSAMEALRWLDEQTENIVFYGDSRTTESGMANNALLLENQPVGSRARIYADGWYSYKTTTLATSNFLAMIDRFKPTGAGGPVERALLVFGCGFNDASAGSNGPAIWRDYTNIAGFAKSRGYSIGTMTFNDGGTTPNDYYENIRTNEWSRDRVLPLERLFPDTADTTMYQAGGLHFTEEAAKRFTEYLISGQVRATNFADFRGTFSGKFYGDPMEVITVTGTNFSIDWSKEGGFLAMAGNYALTNIANLSSNNIRHEYWLYLTQDASGTRTFTNQNGLVQWPGGTNGYVPITTNAGRTDRIIFSTSRYQTNVYGSQDFNRY